MKPPYQRTRPLSNYSSPSIHPHLLTPNHALPNKKINAWLINDSDYNSIIYQWRRFERAPIVNVFCVKEEKEIVNGGVNLKSLVMAENIPKKLNQLVDFNLGETFYILNNMLDGYEAIFRRVGVCSVSLDKCGLNKDGILKVWINSQFERNDVSGEVLTSERNIIEKILRVVEIMSNQKLDNLRNLVESVSMGSWTFPATRKATKIYGQSMKMIIPDRIFRKSLMEVPLAIREYSEESRKENEEIKQFCISSINKLVLPETERKGKGKFGIYHQFNQEISPQFQKHIASTISTEIQSSQDSIFIKQKVLSRNNINSLSIQKNNFNFTFGKQSFPFMQDSNSSMLKPSAINMNKEEGTKQIQTTNNLLELLKREISISASMENSRQAMNQESLMSPALNVGSQLEQWLTKVGKEKEILQANGWKKKLQNLIGVEECELKKSIDCGWEYSSVTELSPQLRSCGRYIGKSIIPIQ